MSASLPPNENWGPATREGLQALRDATEASPADVARLTDRLAAAPPPTIPRWPLAAVPMLLLASGAGLWLARRPVPLDPADVLLDQALTVSGERLAHTDGRGTADVEGDRVRVDWVVGTLETDPAAADRLVVVTPEAEWSVAGAGSLTRDRLGTHIGDADGAGCVGERDDATCLPVQAASWLGRAHALVERGELELAATSFEAARDLAVDDEAVRSEAWAGLADALVRRGDVGEAAIVAEEALADAPGTREVRLHMLAARAHLILGDCAAAIPHLHELPETADEAAYIARCEAQLRSPE